MFTAMHKPPGRLGLAGLLLLGLGTISTGAADLVGIPRILDGDTVEFAGVTVHLDGIDAPETEQLCLDAKLQPWQCGKEAGERLSKKFGDRPWTCRRSGQYRFGRPLASCAVEGEDIGRWMVRSGWALSFKHCSSRTYDDELTEARQSRVGLWSGAFLAPWDWRNGNRHIIIIFGTVSVPTEAHKFLLPASRPMAVEAVTANPSCLPPRGAAPRVGKPAPERAPERDVAAPSTAKPAPDRRISVGPAPAGEPVVVAQWVIHDIFEKSDCPHVVSAARVDDGSITATCNNGQTFRVFWNATVGDVAMRCSAALALGVSGC
jgi:endonuclease YncB( thermonuclease family)